MENRNIDYAFLGGVFPKELELEIKEKSKGNMQYAANTFQWNLINGLDSNIGFPMKLFNLMFIGSYPNKYKDFYIKSSVFSHEKESKDINIGFVNVIPIKQLFSKYMPRHYLKTWITKKNASHKVLFIYSSNFIDIVPYIKKLAPDVHVCLILPDLPCYMNLGKQKNIVYKLYNRYNQQLLNKNIKYVDSFVLLTKQMKEYLELPMEKPYVVIEGIVDNDNSIPPKTTNSNLINVVYTGTLTKKYGIMNLIQAFQYIQNENFRLIICGSGEAEQEIIKFAKKDKRILYKGIVSHRESIMIQQNATVLVNPRTNNESYTKYSFPSKIMEYMMAARPVVCYKIDGIPSEYDNYLSYVLDDTVIGLKDKILEVCALDEKTRDEMGRKNREFVLTEKNHKKQTARILDMIFSAKF